MEKITTVLFDFDGVIANTEHQYDAFNEDLAKQYNLGNDFVLGVKGMTAGDIMNKYFSHYSQEEIARVRNKIDEFEKQMDFHPVEGVLEYLEYLKKSRYKLGLVTSSPDSKMEIALEKMELTDVFDVVITENRITRGKPDPMCYILAAEDLEVSPRQCLVFEDSIHGIEAAKYAGMKVIGVATSIPKELLKEKTDQVMDDFSNKFFLLRVLEQMN